MILLFALTVATLFGIGTSLLLERDLIRVVAGTIVISNASILLIMSCNLTRGVAPFYPLRERGTISDPVVQALALTAIVISFGITALLLSMVYRVAIEHQSTDQLKLVALEIEDLVEEIAREQVEEVV